MSRNEVLPQRSGHDETTCSQTEAEPLRTLALLRLDAQTVAKYRDSLIIPVFPAAGADNRPDLFVPRRESVQAHECERAFALFSGPFILMGQF